MDLLDSIMSKMDKPPSLNDKQRHLLKEQKRAVEESKAREKELLFQFRKNTENRINRFVQDDKAMKKIFEPMDRVARSIVRDVAEVAGLTSYVFGIEGEDRHVMVFKKEYPLTEEELTFYRNGEEYDPSRVKMLAQQKELQEKEDKARAKVLKHTKGSNKFLEKYEKLVGRETGKEAAKIIEVNRQFGFVHSELKKDKRTIEQTLADIRAKKQRKEHGEDTTS